MTLLPVQRVDCDVAVVGAGFAGSITALALCRMGRRVALIERDHHPRFAIGESSTPLANLLLEEIADRFDLPRLRVLSKWGTWQRGRPEVTCGLKRGFSFFFHRPGEPFQDADDHASQLMVAASPHDDIADTHWLRSDFDHALARDAETAGAVYLDDTRLETVRQAGAAVVLEGVRAGRRVVVDTRFVVDASGPRGFLHQRLGLGDAALSRLPPAQALFTHFTKVTRWDALHPPAGVPPFPADDAALHHIFPGGWVWVLRFNNGLTSAGAALTDRLAASIGSGPSDAVWERLLQTLPSVREQFSRARAVLPWRRLPRLAFRSRRICAPGWALLPSAAGVIDPLLSTGFALTLLGVVRLLDVLGARSGTPARAAALRRYEETTVRELEITEQLVAALYATMADAELFKRVALLYFAAVSYSEAARRFGRAELAPGFLLESHPSFGVELRACATLACGTDGEAARAALLARIDRAVAAVDVAGLSDRSRGDWYPALASDLLANASKIGVTRDDVHAGLARSGWRDGPVSPPPARPPARRT